MTLTPRFQDPTSGAARVEKRRARPSGSARAALAVIAALLVAATTARAGGPRAVDGLGSPMAWNIAFPVAYNPDAGPLGLLTNAQARALLSEAFAQWDRGPSSIHFVEGPLLPQDVNAAGTISNPANFRNFYRLDGDGRSPVIFDHDGAIIDAIFGAGARFEIVGTAGLDTPIGGLTAILGGSTEITGASIVINGAFYDGVGLPDSPPDLTRLGLKAAMVHEIGHFINLDHSVLNHELALDGNASNDVYVPTMFPVLIDGEEALATTNYDDQLALINLYEALVDTIGGSVESSSLPFQGGNVVVREIGDPWRNAFSLVSGGMFFPCNFGGVCYPCNVPCDPGHPPERGAFSAGFHPGVYRVCVEQIDTRFSRFGVSLVGPLATIPILPGPEECWNEEDEAGAWSEDPDDASLVFVPLVSSVDIVLNELAFVDLNEPNDTLVTATPLTDLPSGRDTVAGHMNAPDRDIFDVPVTVGQRVRIDIDAAELGSPVDLVLGFYNAASALVARADDAFDPDSQRFTFDPALELVAGFTGTAKVIVSAYPDLDQDGSGGNPTPGGYWLRVEVASDTDGDGAVDAEDVCPATAGDDRDFDGLCFGADNCPTHADLSQLVPTKLNGPLTAGGEIDTFWLSASRVLYRADQDTDETFELYSVPIEGGAVVKLNGALVANGDVLNAPAFTPNGSRVVYRADQDTDELFELYSVPSAGGASVKLNGTLQSSGDVGNFVISPDSATVVYGADQDVEASEEIYSVPITGGTAVQLNGALVAGGDVDSFAVSPTGARVVYVADQDVDEVDELYSVAITGGTPVKLNGTLVAGGDVQGGLGYFAFSPNAATVVYLADQDVDETFELYSVPVVGGTPVKLNGTLVAGGDVLANFQRFVNDTHVIYLADQDTDEVVELYRVPIAGGPSVKLNGPLVSGGDVQSFSVSSDRARVVYLADQDTDGTAEAYSVPFGGGASVKLSGPLVSGGQVISGAFTPDGARFVYRANQDSFDVTDIYSVPSSGGTPVKLNGALVAGGDALGSNAGDPTFLHMDRDTDEVFEVYSVPITGGTPTKLNPVLPPTADAAGQPDPSRTRFVLFVDLEVDERRELYVVDAVGGADTDADGILNGCDLCPTTSDPTQSDSDGNGVGDACQACSSGTDPDADGACDASDNCPTIANAGQADFDTDGAGDACDADDDDDGLPDAVETDTGTFVDGNDTGTDPLDADSDGDGVDDGAEVAAGDDPNDAGELGGAVPFTAGTTITTTAQEVRTVFAADVDRDGDVDVLSASFADDTIAWHENDGASPPGWTERVISSSADGAHGVFAADVDGDGNLDVLSASVLGDTIAWYENDGASPPGWTARTITTAADAAFGVFAADVNGDGDMDVLSASLNDGTIAWYDNDGASPPGWTERAITTTASGAVWVAAADVDRDGDLDALSASTGDHTVAWYENDGASPPVWTQRTITTTATAVSAVVAADVDGDGDLDALAPSPLENTVAWYENDGASPPAWTERVISSAAGTEPNSLSVGDADEDGDLDVLWAATSGRIAWHENLGGSPPAWVERRVDQLASGAGSAVLADLNADGDLDVLAISESTDSVEWYENQTIHRNAAYPIARTISADAAGALSVVAADLDRDGDVDALSASPLDDKIAWYQSDGAAVPGFTAHTISTAADGANSVHIADINSDGKPDVLSASLFDDKIAWYQSDGAMPMPGFTAHTISTAANGASSVYAADLDGDGDTDVLSASNIDDQIAWYRNDGVTPVPGWTALTISLAANGAASVHAADLDGDGDIDVLSASSVDDKIAWYLNDGAATPGWTTIPIDTTADGAVSVFAADLDRDGDVDVLAASQLDDTIAWYDNDGAALPGWTARPIATLAGKGLASSVRAADLDRDGDLDVLVASDLDHTVLWYTNDGASPPAWTERTVTNAAFNVAAAFATDVDSDGDLDVLSASQGDDRIAWYENRGGQFSMATTSVAPGSIPNGATRALLAIDVSSNGSAGDHAVELATVELLVTDGSGSPLSSAEANLLIDRLRVHLDDGSLTFDAEHDLVLAIIDDLELSPQVIEMTPGDPRVRIAAGQSKRFFVVAEVAQGASFAGTGSFRVTHVTETSSKVRDAVTGALLQMEYKSNESTASISASSDVTPPAVIGVFPAAASVDVARSTDVVVYLSEPVDPASAAAGVALSIGGLKVPGTVSVSADGFAVTFDPESILALDTDYVVGVSAALTDRAGNFALPFSATFETTSNAAAGDILAGEFGDTAGGRTLEGNADDGSGFATAALRDVNGTVVSNGVADLIIGAPNADAGGVDAGRATLVFGGPALQSNASAVTSLTYRTAAAGSFIGETVAPAGDMNADGIHDFLIGAPRSNEAGSDAGIVYLVFGDPGLDEAAPGPLDLDDLALCSVSTLCGVKFLGEAADDLAGAAVSYAGDVNGDGADDILIGAPGADPPGRSAAGKVYLIYGPLTPGVIPLAQVGLSEPGLVLHGESPNDRVGAAVSHWEDERGDGLDDLLLGAPGAEALDELGASIPNAGYVYAVWGGTSPGRLDDSASPGVIELARVASGLADQVAGMVFVGAFANRNIGRSLTGAADTNGDGIPDVIFSGNGVAFVIPGDGPKTVISSTQTGGVRAGGVQDLGRFFGVVNALSDLGGVRYETGDSNPLTVGATGDIDNDGVGDFIVGAPLADSPGRTDAGKAYVILGSPAPGDAVRSLSEVGATIAGFVVEGVEAGDNLGASVGGGSDVNADGISDGLAGAPFADSGTGSQAGETYVISPTHPDEVVQLRLLKLGGVTRLEWSVPDLATTYNVYRGLLSVVRSAGVVRTSDMTPLACDIATDADADQLPDTDDAGAAPASGAVYVYLVTARNLQGEGPLGRGSALVRLNDAQCP